MTTLITASNLIHELLPNPGVTAQTQAITAAASLPALNATTDIIMLTSDGNLRYTLDGSTPTSGSLEVIYEGFPVYWNATTYAAAKVIAESGTVNVRITELIYPTNTARRAAELSTDMETVTFDYLYNRLLRKRNLNPASAVLDASQEEDMAELLTERMLMAYEYTWWPDLIIMEQRDTVDSGDGVYVPYSGSGLINLGSVRAVYRDNPYTVAQPRQLTYIVRRDGVYLPGSDLPATVWVDYRLRAPKFTRVDYSADTAYAAGEYVYYSTTGQCYMAIQAGTGNAPTNTAYWEQQEIPRMFAQYAIQGAFADFLIDDGEQARGYREDARADRELERIFEVQRPQQGQVDQVHVETVW